MMASRISASFVRGFRVFAASRVADSAVAGHPGGLMSAAYNEAVAGDPKAQENPRAITYHNAQVNGCNIHFAKTGNGNSPVLLLPGALGSALTDFVPQLEGMNKDIFTLIAWDPRGYGRSQDSPRDWSDHFLERDAHDAAVLMKELNFKKYSLVGWSDGGITALIMSAKYPHRIRKCVALAANTYVTEQEVANYQAIADISKWSDRMRAPFIDMYGEEKFQRLWAEWIEWFSKFKENPEGDICKSMLKDITCPLLVVQGQKDPLVPSFHADYIAKSIPTARLVKYPEGKHNLHFKFGKEFNSLIESFLIEPQSTVPPSPVVPEQ